MDLLGIAGRWRFQSHPALSGLFQKSVRFGAVLPGDLIIIWLYVKFCGETAKLGYYLTGLTGWTGFYPVDPLGRKPRSSSTAIGAENKQLKAIYGIWVGIEQDSIQPHPENPVIPSKKNSRSGFHKN